MIKPSRHPIAVINSVRDRVQDLVAQREIRQFNPFALAFWLFAFEKVDDLDSIVLHVAQTGRACYSTVDVSVNFEAFKQGKQVVACDVGGFLRGN